MNQEKNYSIWHPLGNVINHECSHVKHEYQHVGNVTAQNKEQAFINSQRFSAQWADRNVRSTSVGDIISDGDRHFMVKGMGFQEIDTLTRLYILRAQDNLAKTED